MVISLDPKSCNGVKSDTLFWL